MASYDSQLDFLREKVARINAKYSTASTAVSVREPLHVEEWLPGAEMENSGGKHYQTTRLWQRHKRHGSVYISTLAELPADLLDAVSEGTVPPSESHRWAFLDTETTGLAGGTGTYAFLIGLGFVTADGFQLKQYFLREPGEEASALRALHEDLQQFDVLVTYNGKAFDAPLLETRFRLARLKTPFERMAHMDLLHGARRLWKLRLDSCRLVEIENQILGVERQGDVPGELIPYLYFEYLRKREIARLVPIFHHNAIDILTLACLTAVVPYAFRDPSEAHLVHGAEMIGIARWMRKGERYEEAISWMRHGLARRISDELLFRTMWDIAQLERKVGREDAALALYSDLAQSKNPYRIAALEELAKYYEHRERNYAIALEFTRDALLAADTDELRHRRQRLERKLAGRGAAARLI